MLITTTQNLDYNVPGGKLNRGISVVDTVEILKGRALTDEEYFKAALLGWCVELVSPRHLCAREAGGWGGSPVRARSCKRSSSSRTT